MNFWRCSCSGLRVDKVRHEIIREHMGETINILDIFEHRYLNWCSHNGRQCRMSWKLGWKIYHVCVCVRCGQLQILGSKEEIKQMEDKDTIY